MLLWGVLSWAGLAVLWFRLLPGMIAAKGLDLSTLAVPHRVVMSLPFQVVVLLLIMILLAAGAALRVSARGEKSSKVIAVGCGLAFGSLLMTVNLYYDPLIHGTESSQETESESEIAGSDVLEGESQGVNWGK